MGNKIKKLPNISYIQQTVNEKLKESKLPHQQNSDAQVAVVIAMYLQSETYKYHVAVCASLPTLATMDVRKATIEDAKQVVKFFKSIWQENKLTKKFPFPPYVNIYVQSSYYEGTLQLYFENHKVIRNELMELLKSKQAPMHLYVPLKQLLSMAYWLVLFYQGKRHSEPTSYNQHLHGFLSDLVITFITLLSTFFPQNLSITTDLLDLPGILPMVEPPAVDQPDYNTQCHPMNLDDHTTLAYIQGNIQGKFHKCKWTPIKDIRAQIDIVIKMHLLNERYKCHVEACTGLPTEAIDLNRLWNTDAVKIAEAFIETMTKHLNTITEPTYIKIQRKYGPALQENIEKHVYIKYQLIELLRQGMSSQHYLPIVQLLSFAYWLAQYYDKLRQDSKLRKKYNEHLHYFLTDYVILFIGLLSEAFPNNHCLNEVTRNYVPPNRNDSNFRKTIHYIQKAIKVRLEAFDYTPSDNSSALVETAISVHLLCPTYECHIATCTNLSIEAVNLEQFQTKDAEEVVKAFQLIWSEKLDIKEEPYYIQIQNNVEIYLKRLQFYTDMHLKIRAQLMILLNDNEKLMHLYLPIVQLLSLAYWLVLYYNKIKVHRKKKEKYNAHLHSFLSDFVVTFILLLSESFPQNSVFVLHNQRDLPEIKETTVEIVNFAENLIFRELVLLEMANILCTQIESIEGTILERTEQIAQSIRRYLVSEVQWVDWDQRERVHWDRRGTDYLFKIISDQARYMVQNKYKNFVCNKNVKKVIDAINYLNKPEIDIKKILESENQERIHQESEQITLYSLPRSEPFQARLDTEMEAEINNFYHIAFVGIIWYIVQDCPHVQRTGRICVDNYVEFRRQLAKSIIDSANDDFNRHAVNVTKTLRQIIAARCCISDEKHKEGIISDQDHKTHKDEIIYFIAFRALLLYMLPKNLNKYGEQKIAEKLPKYAKENSIFI